MNDPSCVDDHPTWMNDHPKKHHPNRGTIAPTAMTLIAQTFQMGQKIYPPIAAAGLLGPDLVQTEASERRTVSNVCKYDM